METNKQRATPVKNMCDDAKNDARLNVLYSPFRRREVNPQDWESKMAFWKNSLTDWCVDCCKCVFTIAQLKSKFVRNGRPALCLTTVVEEMMRNNEVICLQDLMSKDPNNQSWTSWWVNSFVKTPIIWSFSKMKETLVTKAEFNEHQELVHMAVLKQYSEMLKSKLTKHIMSLDEVKSLMGLTDELSVKATLHWMQLQGQAVVTTINNKTIVKLSTETERIAHFTEADLGLYQLQQNEQALMQMLEQLERERQDVELEARNYIRKGMRQIAKSCLRKKKELEKCIDKRASALENVQVLLSRVKEAESDGEILDSYKMGLSALKATFKNAGLSEDGVGHTMDQVKEVLEVHEEIQSALSEPMAASLDADLEKELAELMAGSMNPKEAIEVPQHPVGNTKTLYDLPDFPNPPTISPSTPPSTKTTAKVAASLLQ